LLALRPQSEFLYLLLSVLALLLLAQHERNRRADTLYTAALVIAAASLTRTIGFTLLAPLAVNLLRHRRREGLMAMGIAVAPILAWHLLHKAKIGYDLSLAVIYQQNPAAALLSRMPQLLSAYWIALKTNLVSQAAWKPIGDLVALCCALPAAWRLIRLRSEALYLGAYGSILLVWPFPEEAERLLWPLLPILLAQPLLLISEWRREGNLRFRLVQSIGLIQTLAVLGLALPAFALGSERYRSADTWHLPEARHLEGWYNPDLAYALDRVNGQLGTLEALQAIIPLVPESDCVAAARPAFVTYVAQRRGAFPPLNSVPDPRFMQELKATGCHYVFMYNATGSQFPMPFHPLHRLPKPIDMLVDHRRAAEPPGTGVMIGMLARID
jgi:hypothetical protein